MLKITFFYNVLILKITVWRDIIKKVNMSSSQKVTNWTLCWLSEVRNDVLAGFGNFFWKRYFALLSQIGKYSLLYYITVRTDNDADDELLGGHHRLLAVIADIITRDILPPPMFWSQSSSSHALCSPAIDYQPLDSLLLSFFSSSFILRLNSFLSPLFVLFFCFSLILP